MPTHSGVTPNWHFLVISQRRSQEMLTSSDLQEPYFTRVQSHCTEHFTAMLLPMIITP